MEVKIGEIEVFIINEEYYIERLKVTKNYTALTYNYHNYPSIFINQKNKFSIIRKVLKIINNIQ